MVATNADHIPPWNALPAESKDVGYDPHRFLGGVDIRSARDILLEYVILDGSIELIRVHSLLLRNR